MQYIITKYLGHTETKPARVKAKQSGGPYSVTVSVGAKDTVETAEQSAVDLLRQRLKWSAMYRAGTHQGGSVWCFPPEKYAEGWGGLYEAREEV